MIMILSERKARSAALVARYREDARLLRQSVRKWRRLVRKGCKPDDMKASAANCSLCWKYNMDFLHDLLSCTGCPVALDSCEDFCQDTPYTRYENYRESLDEDKIVEGEELSALRDWAEAEIDYLEELARDVECRADMHEKLLGPPERPNPVSGAFALKLLGDVWLLRESIKEWKQRPFQGEPAGKSIPTPEACPLCRRYNNARQRDTDCRGCPISEDTGESFCEGSPVHEFSEYLRKLRLDMDEEIPVEEFLKLKGIAVRAVEYLEGLLEAAEDDLFFATGYRYEDYVEGCVVDEGEECLPDISEDAQ